MAGRRKSPTAGYRRLARLRVLTSFDGFRAGEEYDVEVDPLVAGWIAAGVVKIVEELAPAPNGGPEPEVVDRGEDPAGPGSAEPDVPGAIED